MRRLWIIAVLCILVDQASKYGVIFGFNTIGGPPVDVLPPFLVFSYGMNTGINFGLFAQDSETSRWVLVGIALALCIALVLWARRSFHRPIEFLSAGLILGGALGNVIDRLIHPGVLDFINMSCCGIDNPYVFNLADVFIFAGAIGLVLFSGEKQGKNGS